VDNYLNRYLEDEDTNWFFNLDRATVRRATPQELQRFYVAFLNTAYVSSLYLIERTPSDFHERASFEELTRLVTPDVMELIAKHPYTIAHKKDDDDFLGQKIDDLEQLRGYTNLLEELLAVMRKHINRNGPEQSKLYREIAKTWNLYQPKL